MFDFCQSCGDEFFLEDLINAGNKKICKNCNNPIQFFLKDTSKNSQD